MAGGRHSAPGSGPLHRRRGRALPNEARPVAEGEQSAGSIDSGLLPNGEGLQALGLQIDKQRKPGKAKHAKRRHRVKWTLGIIGVVVVLLAGAVAGYAWYLNSQITRIVVKHLVPAPTKGVDVGSQNILLIGSTDRCALTVQNPAYGLCSQGVNGVNSDVVMIAHLNPANHQISLLSIPRDLFVPNARVEGAYKIDAALYEGPGQLVNAIEEDFGIPIQHFVELNFDSFANVVNALGGIKMYFPEPVYDAYSGLDIQTTGCIALNGINALQVVRARHLQYKPPSVTTDDVDYWPYDPQSDLARIRRDHEFLRVLATAVAHQGLTNPIADAQLISNVAPQLVVDSGLSTSDMVDLILAFHGTNAYSVPQLTLPVMVDQFGNYYYQGSDFGDIEFPTEPQDHQVIDQFLGVTSNTDTMNGGDLPAPGAVSVSVVDGSGTYDQATTASALEALGFDVVGTGETEVVGDEVETLVEYDQATPAVQAAAQEVAQSLSGQVIMAFAPTTDGAQVTVVTGTDFAVNQPASLVPSSTTTTPPVKAKGTEKASTTTTTSPTPTTTTLPTPQNFSAPTAPVEAFQPWDPRSCTASGGEGP
jgi:LCP family protein required for cell wall assembly